MDFSFVLQGPLQRFDGPGGWHYLPLDEALSAELRPLVTAAWPALRRVSLRSGGYAWEGALMPIKDGPLFVAVAAPARKELGLSEGDVVRVEVELLAAT